MRHIKVFCFALWLVLCPSIAVNGQNEASLSSRIFEALKAKEPGWKAIGGIENHTPPRAKRKAHFLCGVGKPEVAFRRCARLCLRRREPWRGSGVVGTSS